MENYLTKNNHFKFGYNEQPFQERSSIADKWFVDYGVIRRPTESFRQECLTAAQEIASSTKKPIAICLSGGIDSELVAEAFRLANIPFTAVILKIDNSLNAHDVAWADRYTQQHNIASKVFNFDVLEFYKTTEFMEIANQTKCFFPMLIVQMKVMEWAASKGLFPILGSAECYLEKQNNIWVMYEREIFSSLYTFQKQHEIQGLCGFFQWSPELMYSFLVDDLVKKLAAGEIPNAHSTLEIKPLIYNQHFTIEKRPKYYGWETFAQAEAQLRSLLSEKFKNYANEIKIPYQMILKKLNPHEIL